MRGLIFALLFLVSILRPESIYPGIGVPVGPLFLICAVTVFCYLVHKTGGLGRLLRIYGREIFILCTYQSLCVASLIYNFDRYTDLDTFLRWGVVFVIGQCLFPICIFIFHLSLRSTSNIFHHSNSDNFFFCLVTLMSASLIILQVYSPETATIPRNLFVSWDLEQKDARLISGLFATSTDAGAILGIILFALIWQICTNRSAKISLRFCYAALSAMTVYAGSLTNSRNFILFLVVSCLAAAIFLISNNKKGAIKALVLLLAGLFIAPFFLPQELAKGLGEHMPYMWVLANGNIPTLADFVPNLSLSSFGLRGEIWSTAITTIKQNVVIGVSNGGFRLIDGADPIHNTHNVFLQVLIDAGLLGFIVLTYLASRILARSRKDIWFVSLLSGTIATLLVDNFTDHSYAWMVVAAHVFTSIRMSAMNGVKSEKN